MSAFPAPFPPCSNCGAWVHRTLDCVIRQPVLGGIGNCLRCGAANLEMIDLDDQDDPEDDEDFFQCPECGLVANATT